MTISLSPRLVERRLRRWRRAFQNAARAWLPVVGLYHETALPRVVCFHGAGSRPVTPRRKAVAEETGSQRQSSKEDAQGGLAD